jgi:Rps23 Pro-64 3,4-dihydroxylase Tpa1-like proline 4-hydroxylase
MNNLLDRLLPYEKILDPSWKKQLAQSYLSASAYPHVVIDNFFDEAVLDRVVEDFPTAEQFYQKFNNAREIKYATRSELEIPPFARTLIHSLNSGTFISFLEDVTGIDGLVADPHLWGGGFHELPRGGKLAIHTDFNFHKKLNLDRRVNVLIYLNRNWVEAYGGQFEAWRPNGSQAEARYLPIFNRLVIFGTTDFTFHGNPEPVVCPEGMSRKSIAMYYYTNGRPKDEWSGVVQTTQFMNRPGEDIVERQPLIRRLIHVMPKLARIWISHNILAQRS